ncbi:MAG: hypothetical protein A7315_02585 [Candidatus Altiarchaeales archaeon WOR_SM1_79]|nr:MAG: hypothetical protein A7315_02585 [Candidatus Altiarchaeales archaeon WOR_SM1_79]
MIRKREDTTLTLFFTGGVSLKTWADVGNLDRELGIYKRLSDKLKRVNFITYGGKQDEIYADNLGDIKLLPARWYSRRMFTTLHLLLKYYSELNDTDIIKTNQIPGSEIPLWFKKHLGKKLIVRCGYLHSRNTIKESKDEKVIRDAVELERNAFSAADMGIVTSTWQRDRIMEQYNLDPEKIKVIPNYVVTDVFKPHPEIKKNYDLVFVGRGGKEKNIDNLLKAMHYLKRKKRNISLLMVGGCYRDKKIKETANNYALDVTFKGNMPNFDLPYILNQARVFILPSYYEGHPKTLLEAMSCGLPCIGSDVTGIKEDIEHIKTGYLCDTDHESIANAIETVISDEALQKTIGKNAREYILKKYSIDQILEMELKVIREVIDK